MTNEELVKAYQEGDFEALDELIAQNTGLVKYFANKYCGLGKSASLEFSDLEQEGWIAFLDAVEKYQFNDEEPALFSSYAGMRIKYRILNYLNRNICRQKKNDTSSDKIRFCSINGAVPGIEDMTIEDFIGDESSELPFITVEEAIDNGILRKDLLHVINRVLGTGRGLMRKVLKLHYGLNGSPMTLQQIGELWKMSGSRIQQMEYKALEYIRKSEDGKALMKKYKWIVIDSLEQEKDQITQCATPEKILDRMESIDELLIGILKKCC